MDTDVRLLVGALIGREISSSIQEFKLYHYNPTIGGAVAFVLLFLGTTSLHIYQSFRARCWFVIPFIMGGIFEFIGYAARCVSGKESPNWTLGPYIAQSLLLLVAPSLFAATIYMELGRIISLVNGEPYCLIRKKWLTKIFVFGDILSFFLQGGGGGYQASGTASALETGAHIIIVGLFVQLVFFGFFIVVAVKFHLSISRVPTVRSSNELPWQKHMNALYIASIFIMVRSIFRVVEYLQGFNGYLLHHEAYLYIFDALLMFLVMVLLNVVHPSELAASMKHKTAMDHEFNLRVFTERHQRLGSDMS
ncbi:RTA1 like domain-containing protein [Trichoderma velutinum]